jgi:hypothetical protein
MACVAFHAGTVGNLIWANELLLQLQQGEAGTTRRFDMISEQKDGIDDGRRLTIERAGRDNRLPPVAIRQIAATKNFDKILRP